MEQGAAGAADVKKRHIPGASAGEPFRKSQDSSGALLKTSHVFKRGRSALRPVGGFKAVIIDLFRAQTDQLATRRTETKRAIGGEDLRRLKRFPAAQRTVLEK
jgi:hypothetical protein